MLTIVVGGQYGGEGKGKVTAYLAKRANFPLVSRCGGPNSSHTVVDEGRTTRLRLLPTAVVTASPRKVIFGAGSLLHLPTLFSEMDMLGVARERVLIDRRAGVITDECVEAQRRDARYAQLGSTLTGTGQGSARRALRSLPLAEDFPELHSMLGDVSMYLFETLHRNSKLKAAHRTTILVEGHQGAGLSNYHGDYPYTSSRDCIAAALLSELGVSPTWPLRIVLAVKIFPTRNHAGRLIGELSREETDAFGIVEHGGGSWGIEDRRRRVGVFDIGEVVRAVRLNGATEIALTGADYLDPQIKGEVDPRRLTRDLSKFIARIEKTTHCPVRYVSTGPETDAMIDRQAHTVASESLPERPDNQLTLPNIAH